MEGNNKGECVKEGYEEGLGRGREALKMVVITGP
jgi:hypothetical protein